MLSGGVQAVLLSVTGAGIIDAEGAVKLPIPAPIAPLSAPAAILPPLTAEPIAPVPAPIKVLAIVDGTPAVFSAVLT